MSVFTTFFSPQGQEMYAPNSGYFTTQYPGGVPMAVLMQAGGGIVPAQTVTPGPQGSQPQMVVVPVSGMVGNQLQFAQIATSIYNNNNNNNNNKPVSQSTKVDRLV